MSEIMFSLKVCAPRLVSLAVNKKQRRDGQLTYNMREYWEFAVLKSTKNSIIPATSSEVMHVLNVLRRACLLKDV